MLSDRTGTASLVSLLCLELFGNSHPARERSKDRKEEERREKRERERHLRTSTTAAQEHLGLSWSLQLWFSNLPDCQNIKNKKFTKHR